MLARIALFLGVSLLFTHELDAILHQEWRILPLTSWLEESIAIPAFVWAHVPLFALSTAALASNNYKIRRRSEIVLSAFTLIHAGLHMLFSGHEHYDFHGLQSTLLIYGAAIFGGFYLALKLRSSWALTFQDKE